MNSTSDFVSQMTQRIIQNGNLYVEFMKTVMEAAQAANVRAGSGEKPDEIRNKLSQHWQALYQESIGKYLEAPQFGISKEALQQFNSAVTAHHKFLEVTGDFLMKFGTPLKNSMDILPQAIKDHERANGEFISANEVYNFVVKILDKAYDDWLKSPEGVQSVANIVDKYLEYKKNLNPVRDTWLKSLSIPTKREMEDVYRGIYDLKKKARQQDTVIRKQADTIKKLNNRIRKLEVSLAEPLPQKKSAASRSAQYKKKTGRKL